MTDTMIAHPATAPEAVFAREKSILRNRLWLRTWLGIVLLAIFVLVLVGGATRLTDSGLSITQWKPIHGIVPPMGAEQWQEEFDLYRQIPEYQLINKGMSLDEFKVIYWWEWAHRFLARLVGVLFAAPFVFFLATKRIEPRLRLPLAGLLFLGGLQGFIGWWMVSSGLVDRVDVSQYRLAIHLTLAAAIFAAIVWVIRGLSPHSETGSPSLNLRRAAGALVLLLLVQIYLGGLVAGLDAGLSYNSWPLMDGALVPGQLMSIEPWWRNFFENPKMVQFIHRMGGYVVWFAVLAHMLSAISGAGRTTHARRAIALFALVTIQAAIGIATLLAQAPFGWALAHQGMAILVLGFAVAHWRGFYGEYRRAMAVQIRS